MSLLFKSIPNIFSCTLVTLSCPRLKLSSMLYIIITKYSFRTTFYICLSATNETTIIKLFSINPKRLITFQFIIKATSFRFLTLISGSSRSASPLLKTTRMESIPTLTFFC